MQVASTCLLSLSDMSRFGYAVVLTLDSVIRLHKHICTTCYQSGMFRSQGSEPITCEHAIAIGSGDTRLIVYRPFKTIDSLKPGHDWNRDMINSKINNNQCT